MVTPPVACKVTCESGHVQVEDAAKALKAAQAGVTRAEERAKQLVQEARGRVSDARQRLAEAIVQEYLNGARVGELAARSGYTRETVRRILRAAGIEPG
jgi:acyl-CoA reductase-like NAD-dependent aldehyde dehydrogenase